MREVGGGVSSLDEVEYFIERSKDVPDRSNYGSGRRGADGGDQVIRAQNQNGHPTQLHDQGDDPGGVREVPPGGFAKELCPRAGIKPHFHYAWIREFMEAGKDQKSRTNLKVKVLDFVQLGGPKGIVGGTIFEMWLGAL